jgi:tRNA(Ile)-lysidine synthase
MRLLIETDLAWVAAWEADLPFGNWPQARREYAVDVPGEVNFAEGWVLQTASTELTPEIRLQAQENVDPYQAFFDLSSLTLPMTLRSREPGDRFQPLGFPGGTQKISDYFINRKLPRRARAAWPLVCSAGEVAWVPGYALADPFRLTPATQQVVRMRLIRG